MTVGIDVYGQDIPIQHWVEKYGRRRNRLAFGVFDNCRVFSDSYSIVKGFQGTSHIAYACKPGEVAVISGEKGMRFSNFTREFAPYIRTWKGYPECLTKFRYQQVRRLQYAQCPLKINFFID